jgi:hypothetical protein
VGLGRRGRHDLEGASEGAGGSRRERAPLALLRDGGSQCWRGPGAAPSTGGAGVSAQGWIGGRGDASHRGRMGGRGGASRGCRTRELARAAGGFSESWRLVG